MRGYFTAVVAAHLFKRKQPMRLSFGNRQYAGWFGLITIFAVLSGCSGVSKTMKGESKAESESSTTSAAASSASKSTDVEAKAEPPKPKDGPLAMKFVPLPKGTFYLGWDSENKKATKTEIKADFEIAVCTVTQGQGQELMGNNPSYFFRDGKGKDKVKDITDNDLKQFPVEWVSWDDAQKFVSKLNEREKGKGWLYRLPTEAEWGYACRGGATSEEECSFDYYFAKPTNDLSSKEANIGGKPGRTTNVGLFAPNKLGLCDMHSNIFQWCGDLDGPKASGSGASYRVLRGGGWLCCGGNYRAADRLATTPDIRDLNLGCRLARVRVEGK